MQKKYGYSVFVVFLLSAITLCFYTFVEQYRIVGYDLLLNGQFNNDLKYWDTKAHSDTTITKVVAEYLLIASEGSSVTVSQTLSVPDGKLIKVSADVSIMNVLAGKKGWEKARIYVVNYVNGKKIWHQRHHLFSLAGTASRSFYQEVFTILPTADKLEVAIQLANSSGVMAVDNVSAYVVEKKQEFQYLSFLLMFFWLAFAGWMICLFFKQKYFYYLLAGSTLVLILMLVPHELKQLIIDWVKAGLFLENQGNTIDLVVNHNDFTVQNRHSSQNNMINNASQSSIILTFSKLGHFAIFFIYTFFIVVIKKSLNLRIITFLICFAMVTETLQLFTIDRQANIMDFFINVLGIVVSIALLLFIRMLIMYKRQEKIADF